jgi:hypothetical protein
MMEDFMKDSLVLYTAYYDKFRKLSDEQFGQLIRYMLSYQKTGVVPEIKDFAMSIAFDVAKEDMDRNNKKYDEICERNRKNGMRGGRPKKPDGFDETQKTQVVSEKPKKADNDTDNDTDNDNDTDIKERVGTLPPGTDKGEVVYFKKSRKFTPPSVEEVAEYCRDRNNSVDAETFVDFYASKGWKVGKESMKDWKACVRTWEKRDKAERPAKAYNAANEDAINKASLEKLQALEDFYLNGGNT